MIIDINVPDEDVLRFNGMSEQEQLELISGISASAFKRLTAESEYRAMVKIVKGMCEEVERAGVR